MKDSWERWWVKVLPGQEPSFNIKEGEMYYVKEDRGEYVVITDDNKNIGSFYKTRFTKMGVKILNLEDHLSIIKKEINS